MHEEIISIIKWLWEMWVINSVTSSIIAYTHTHTQAFGGNETRKPNGNWKIEIKSEFAHPIILFLFSCNLTHFDKFIWFVCAFCCQNINNYSTQCRVIHERWDHSRICSRSIFTLQTKNFSFWRFCENSFSNFINIEIRAMTSEILLLYMVGVVVKMKSVASKCRDWAMALACSHTTWSVFFVTLAIHSSLCREAFYAAFCH